MQAACPCATCQHFFFDEYMRTGVKSCSAFTSIPNAVYYGSNSHRDAISGDNGYRYYLAGEYELERRAREKQRALASQA